MALDWILWTVGIWLLIGAVCAGLVYQDQVNRGAKGWKWPLLCIPLSLIGYVMYYSSLRRDRPQGRELPARAQYGAPEYKFNEPAQEWKGPETAPLPPEPALKEVGPSHPETKREEAKLEPVAPEPLSPPPMESPDHGMPLTEPVKPKAQAIEGIPRCEECGAAVSSYDQECRNCGKPLKH